MSRNEREFHRKTAVRCYNETWKLLEKKARSVRDTQMMLQLAHASRFHWGLVGRAGNLAVGDWQISRVYAALGQADISLLYAKSSLAICKRERLSEVLATAFEAMARACAVAGDYRFARKYIKKAREQLNALPLEEEERKVYLGQIEETQRLIRR